MVQTNSELLINRWFIYGFLYTISGIFLMVLLFVFICKLRKLHNEINDGRIDDSYLISVITKNIILAFISISCTLTLSFVMIIKTVFINIPIEVAYTFILVDIVTNAICVMLTYNYYEVEYYKLCG